jgi:hypothetical protein
MRRTPDEPTQGTEPHFRHTVGIIGHYVIILDTLEGHLRPFYRRGPKKTWFWGLQWQSGSTRRARPTLTPQRLPSKFRPKTFLPVHSEVTPLRIKNSFLRRYEELLRRHYTQVRPVTPRRGSHRVSHGVEPHVYTHRASFLCAAASSQWPCDTHCVLDVVAQRIIHDVVASCSQHASSGCV